MPSQHEFSMGRNDRKLRACQAEFTSADRKALVDYLMRSQQRYFGELASPPRMLLAVQRCGVLAPLPKKHDMPDMADEDKRRMNVLNAA